ncbi:MAG: flagellar protein FlaG [Epsilonproteobacteria bacterium]|nr:hypothetical protein [Campylobacterota bacterium]NPA56280.1 flagellar protein FlaG [Campylobacterota bacterium]
MEIQSIDQTLPPLQNQRELPSTHQAGEDRILEELLEESPGEQNIGELLQQLEEEISTLTTNLRVEVEEERDGIRVVKIVDRRDGVVIQQFPPEAVIEMVKRIGDDLSSGLLVDKEV